MFTVKYFIVERTLLNTYAFNKLQSFAGGGLILMIDYCLRVVAAEGLGV